MEVEVVEPLLVLEDISVVALEIELPAKLIDCRRYTKLVVGISDGPVLSMHRTRESVLP